MFDRNAILDELRAGFSREWASGFNQLSRIPSTRVRKFLDYFASLNADEKDALSLALTEGAFDFLFPGSAEPLYKRNAAYRKYVDEIFHMTGRRYSSVRALRGTLSLANEEPSPPPSRPRRPRMALAKPPSRSLLTAEDRKWISAIQLVTSNDIRKCVKLALSQVLLPLSVVHNRGHLWEYSGNLRDVPVLISIDYASPACQLEYWVSIRNERTGLWGSNFERLMGLSSGGWDLLEGANLDQSVKLMCEHIYYCASFLNQLPACPSAAG